MWFIKIKWSVFFRVGSSDVYSEIFLLKASSSHSSVGTRWLRATCSESLQNLNDSLNSPLLQLQLVRQKPQWLGSSEGFLRLVCAEPPDLKAGNVAEPIEILSDQTAGKPIPQVPFLYTNERLGSSFIKFKLLMKGKLGSSFTKFKLLMKGWEAHSPSSNYLLMKGKLGSSFTKLPSSNY